MVIQLSSKNVLNYLRHKGLDLDLASGNDAIQVKDAKNFNLLLTLRNGDKWLVKQERFDAEGKTAEEFKMEWRVQEFSKGFHGSSFQGLLPDVLLFDPQASILVLRYLDHYQDLLEFYVKDQLYPEWIAEGLGTAIATIHQDTVQNSTAQSVFDQGLADDTPLQSLAWTHKLHDLEPDIFGQYPAEGIKFFSLYQRYDSLGRSIQTTLASYRPLCVTHNDLKLNNVLVHQDWQNPRLDEPPIRLIDWERNGWGDPAFDVGTLLSSYLQQWLGSLLVSQDISFQDSLQMATTPLEKVRPSMVKVLQAYLGQFPEILEIDPDFLDKVVQFSGLVMINQIFAMLQYQKTFGNTGICMLQVAKSLLCRPDQSFATVLGISQADFIASLGSRPRSVAS
ncbi:phosphotransferase family protein [Lyngbya confervoides]|uniref:Aminoglycoside phosphotransferase family protein n=1 Tax=Lyngbya confervoides BDU141951 TaxID=1574623 RepID=A0ABD4T4F2_9CYAN|nr:phosphotransferase [Lyngbya confervoides]MCM1983597.1 aminoglycoside phosphotransferase family protein [Lyngbya confervoides BDU141951]